MKRTALHLRVFRLWLGPSQEPMKIGEWSSFSQSFGSGRLNIMQTKTKENYKEYLQSNHWKQLRTQAWGVYGYRCFFHKHRTKYVELHHINYRDWYGCTVKDLVPLCRECHENAHKNESWLRATKKAVDKYWSETPKKIKEIKLFEDHDPQWLKDAKTMQIAKPSKRSPRSRPNKSGRVYEVYSRVDGGIMVVDGYRKLSTAQKVAKRLNKKAKKEGQPANYNFRTKPITNN